MCSCSLQHSNYANVSPTAPFSLSVEATPPLGVLDTLSFPSSLSSDSFLTSDLWTARVQVPFKEPLWRTWAGGGGTPPMQPSATPPLTYASVTSSLLTRHSRLQRGCKK